MYTCKSFWALNCFLFVATVLIWEVSFIPHQTVIFNYLFKTLSGSFNEITKFLDSRRFINLCEALSLFRGIIADGPICSHFIFIFHVYLPLLYLPGCGWQRGSTTGGSVWYMSSLKKIHQILKLKKYVLINKWITSNSEFVDKNDENI